MKINKTSLALSIIGGTVISTNPVLGAAFITASFLNYMHDIHVEKEINRRCTEMFQDPSMRSALAKVINNIDKK